MLTGLTITNLALIAQLEVTCASGLTVLTGETGAGKSMLLSALALALGGRAEVGLIRQNETICDITATFQPAPNPKLQEILQQQGQEEAGPLILRRQLKREGASGKETLSSKAWLNGTPVPLTVLAQVGACVVDIHGQHGHTSLLQPATQRDVLDELAAHLPLRHTVAQTHAAWQQAVQQHAQLQQQLAQAANQAEFLQHQRQQLEELNYQENEEESLLAQRQQLQHAGQLAQQLGAADDALSNSAVGALRVAARSLTQAAQLNPALTDLATRLTQTELELADIAHSVARAAQAPECSGSLEEIDDRLHALKAAARRHQVSISQLPEVLATLVAQTSGADVQQAQLDALAQQVVSTEKAFRSACQKLTQARAAAAEKIAPQLQRTLRQLMLPHAVVLVQLTPLPPAQWSAAGAETLEIWLSTNPGHPAQPVGKVASGGELSRLVLALKSVLYQGLPPQTVVLDEIDTGLTGAAASAMGQAMAALGQRHQVLAITHHPQVAAVAAQHWRLSKLVSGGSTRTQLTPLTGPARLEELARLLAGNQVTLEARAAAQSLLAEAAQTIAQAA